MNRLRWTRFGSKRVLNYNTILLMVKKEDSGLVKWRRTLKRYFDEANDIPKISSNIEQITGSLQPITKHNARSHELLITQYFKDK